MSTLKREINQTKLPHSFSFLIDTKERLAEEVSLNMIKEEGLGANEHPTLKGDHVPYILLLSLRIRL